LPILQLVNSLYLIQSLEYESYYAKMETPIETVTIKPFETLVLTKDKKEIRVLFSGRALKDVQGEPIGFVDVCGDITERKWAE